MKNYQAKTKLQLIEEIESLKNKIEKLEQSGFKINQTEEALQKSEAMFKSIFSQAPGGIELYDSKGNLINANQECLNIFGVGHIEDVMGFKLFEDPNISAEAKTQLRNGEPVDYESEFDFEAVKKLKLYKTTRSGKYFLRVQITPYEISVGGEKGFVVHVQDITERKQAESQLNESKRMLNDVLNTIPVRVFWKDLDGVYLGCNQLFAKDAGRSNPEELIGDNDYNMGWAEQADLYRSDDRSVIESGQPKINYKEPQTTPNGDIIWLNTSKIPLRNSSGNVYGVLGTYEDITERKRAEEVLQENEEKLRNIVEYSTNLFYSHTPDHVLTYVSPQTREFFDCEPEEALISWTEFVTDNPLNNKGLKFTEEAIKTGERQPVYEFELVGKKGRIIWVEVSEAPVVENGKTVAIVGALIDITERKKAEKELKDSEYLLRESQKVANLGSYVLDMPGSIWKSSPILDDVFGIDKKYNKDISNWLNIVHPEDRVMMQDYFAINVLTNHESFNKEYRIKRINDRQERWVHGLGELDFNDDGNPIKLIGTIQDITDRKLGEMALQKSEESLKLAQEFGKVGSWDWDILNNKLTWSDQSFIQLGLKPNEIEPTREVLDNFIHPDDRGLISGAIEQTLKHDKPYSVETRMIKPDGKEWIMHTKGKVIRDENGTPIRFVGVQQDITERKKAEEARRESEERFSRLSGAAFEGIVISDAGKIIDVNDQLAKMMGYKPEEIIGKHAMEFVAPESRELVMNKIKSGTEGSYEHFALKNDGSIFPVEVQAKALPYEGRSFRVTAIRDTTERKKAEEEIRKLSHSVEQSPAIVMITDMSGNIEYVNPKFEEVTGYTAKEVIGKNPSILKFGETTPEEYEILWKTIKAGGAWHGEFHNRKKNGELYWESASISAIKDTKGQLTHYIAIKEDITGRKEMDKRLRESHNRLRSFAERLQMIREEERATIAREIHDDLGQSLTALKMDISWVKNNPEMDVEAKMAKFDMMLDLTNSTIQTVKRIATELRPGILDDLGLIPAIEWQTAEFQNRFKIQCNISINKSDVIIKDEISIAVFRIFQETLTNVARHSGATKVDIKLNFHVDNKLTMEITDNGVGIDEEQINSLKSLGLFGMRERVNILNGEMEIIGERGKGTKVKVLIPVSIEELGNKN